MPTFTFFGNRVGALAEANWDGLGGVNLELDNTRDLSGGNPWYSATDIIQITIDEEDIGPNGEILEGGVDGKAYATSITVNGVELLSGPAKIKLGDGTKKYDSDAFLQVQGIDLVFLAPQSDFTFDDTDTSGPVPILNIPERVVDLDLNEDGDTDDVGEIGDGVFNIMAADEDLDGDATEYADDLLNGILGTGLDDTISGNILDDTISGGAGNDDVSGGAGDDLLLGDLNTGDGVDATPINLTMSNLESVSYSGNHDAQVGDFAVYRDVATLDDGSTVWARLVLTDLSDPDVEFGLAAQDGWEMQFKEGQPGAEATVRMEFFDPVTGLPVALNAVVTFNDIDADSATSVESVTLNTNTFTGYAVTGDTSLNVADTDDGINVSGTTSTDPDDQGAWLSARFENQNFIEFTLGARDSYSGFSFFGDVITDADYVPIEQGSDTLSGGDGSDTIYGEGGDDVLDGGADNDVIYGGDGEDLMSGGDGNDILAGNDGSDTIFGGDGSDYIVGGAGDDVLTTGIGDDTLLGGEGDDTLKNSSGDDSLVGGAGNDSLVASSGDDTLEGGTGADTMIGGTDDDSLVGGDGNDSMMGDFQAAGLVEASQLFAYEYYELDAAGPLATLADAGFTTGTENDNPPDGEGVVGSIDPLALDTFHGGNGDTFAVKLTTTLTVTSAGTYTFDLTSDDGAKIYVDGVELVDNDGVHTATTVSNSTTLTAGEHLVEILYFDNGSTETLSVDLTGPDTGGGPIPLETASLSTSFDDTLEGGAGNDVLTGGLGDDIFIYNAGDGADTITDFNTGNTGTLLDGNNTNNDFIDLSAYYDNLSELYADQLDDGILNQSNTLDGKGRTIDWSNNTAFGAGSVTFTGATADSSFFTYENTAVVCFAESTRIKTAQGEIPVERLKCGDLVQTMDNGLQPVLWTGVRPLQPSELAAHPELKPVVVAPTLTGGDAPLLVSWQHGLLLNVDGEERLLRAVHLKRMRGGCARAAQGQTSVTYHHFMLPRHEIVFANGAPAESFYPGQEAIGALPKSSRIEIARLFPDLLGVSVQDAFGTHARPFLARRALPESLRAFSRAEMR